MLVGIEGLEYLSDVLPDVNGIPCKGVGELEEIELCCVGMGWEGSGNDI